MLIASAAIAQQPTTAPASQPASVAVPGSISAFYMTDLFAKDSGYLSEVKVDIGDHVKRGDVLALIDDPELAQQLKSAEAMLAAKQQMAKAAEANVQQAKASLVVAQKQLAAMQAESQLASANLTRQEALFKEKAATTQQTEEYRAKSQVATSAADVGQAKIASAEADVTAAEANRAVAAAQVQIAQADVERVRTLLGYTKIVAPFDGIITRRLVSPGDLVQTAITNRTAPLFTCAQVNVVRVFCDVPEANAGAIQTGMKAEVKLAGSAAPISATVTRIAASMDPATRTMRVEIDLPNENEALKPGMYAQVTLYLSKP
jgi:multidrug efflux pump subunit AcrA (membrane-fusion protein)